MRKIGVKEITKLAEGHIANKPKNQDQGPLPPNSYKTKQQQQLTANKSTCHVFLPHLSTLCVQMCLLL